MKQRTNAGKQGEQQEVRRGNVERKDRGNREEVEEGRDRKGTDKISGWKIHGGTGRNGRERVAVKIKQGRT